MVCLSFFFQAEDGIRDKLVTGVQTCALPISRRALGAPRRAARTPSRHHAPATVRPRGGLRSVPARCTRGAHGAATRDRRRTTARRAAASAGAFAVRRGREAHGGAAGGAPALARPGGGR